MTGSFFNTAAECADELEDSLELLRTALAIENRGDVILAAKALWADAEWLLRIVRDRRLLDPALCACGHWKAAHSHEPQSKCGLCGCKKFKNGIAEDAGRGGAP